MTSYARPMARAPTPGPAWRCLRASGASIAARRRACAAGCTRSWAFRRRAGQVGAAWCRGACARPRHAVVELEKWLARWGSVMRGLVPRPGHVPLWLGLESSWQAACATQGSREEGGEL